MKSHVTNLTSDHFLVVSTAVGGGAESAVVPPMRDIYADVSAPFFVSAYTLPFSGAFDSGDQLSSVSSSSVMYLPTLAGNVWSTVDFTLQSQTMAPDTLPVGKQLELFFAGAAFITPLLVVMLVIRYSRKAAVVV